MDKEKVLDNIKNEIEKIMKKENHIFFFVIDTKGTPSGSLEYIYNLALITKKLGYNVSMLYSEDEEFVGVREWLGNEYADLEHLDIEKNDVSVSPSDILFIPELFSNVMNQTKKLPCKKVAILQNFDYICEQTPISAQWGNYNILECLTNTENNRDALKTIFPYVTTKVVSPFITDYAFTPISPKKLIVNIVSRNQRDINKIIKPFYWKYPMFKFVSFKDLRGFSKKDFIANLKESAITIWVDDETPFGYSALEALKCGNVVIAKTPNNSVSWMHENGDVKNPYTNACLWFNNLRDVQDLIATVVRSWTLDKIPEDIQIESKNILSRYSYENTYNSMKEYIEYILNKRLNEMENIMEANTRIEKEEVNE